MKFNVLQLYPSSLFAGMEMSSEDRIDLFRKGNPFHFNPTGRIEAKNFIAADVYADFWTRDSRKHIMNAWTRQSSDLPCNPSQHIQLRPELPHTQNVL